LLDIIESTVLHDLLKHQAEFLYLVVGSAVFMSSVADAVPFHFPIHVDKTIVQERSQFLTAKNEAHGYSLVLKAHFIVNQVKVLRFIAKECLSLLGLFSHSVVVLL